MLEWGRLNFAGARPGERKTKTPGLKFCCCDLTSLAFVCYLADFGLPLSLFLEETVLLCFVALLAEETCLPEDEAP